MNFPFVQCKSCMELINTNEIQGNVRLCGCGTTKFIKTKTGVYVELPKEPRENQRNYKIFENN
jgi:hypothetical protein